uniref:Glycosyl transferase family 25 domain-containing protein n=1 Tax=viral metagenome TaxID=1070528 RepID=A0A6C0JIW8_9ZZZZ
MYIYITIIIISIIISYLFIFKNKNEFFSNDNIFKCYVISLKQENRLKNIEKQQKKVDSQIVIFDAVNGDTIDVNTFNEPPIIISKDYYDNSKRKKRQLGCYLSHFKIYTKIKNDANNGYTIIFEDDFDVRVDKLLEKCNTTIDTLNSKDMDFDIIYLGNHDYQSNHGELVVKDIYKVGNNEFLYGTQGYIVNNKNIDKIIDKTKNITITIDDKIQQLANDKQLNVFSTFPYYVGAGEEPTIIAEPFKEYFTNYSFI